MNKQIIMAILIFSAIAVIGSGIYYFSTSQGRNNGDNITGQSDGQPKENNKNVLPQVKKLNCEDIIDAKEKENCLAGVMKLLNSGNSSVCEGLTAEADKNTCRQSYTIKQAAQSEDLTKCNQAASAAMISDCQAQVSFSLAIQKKDKKYCENIINKTDKKSCLKVLTGMGVK
jgi:hypothetical protein